jgi:hypothetical protein
MNTIHIVPHHGRGWVIKYFLNEAPSVVFERKQEAIDAARKISAEKGGSILLHESPDAEPISVDIPKRRRRRVFRT